MIDNESQTTNQENTSSTIDKIKNLSISIAGWFGFGIGLPAV